MSPLTEPTRLVLKNYNTPAAIAGVAPTLDYRFALDRTELDAVTLTDKLTLTRAATASFTNLGGNLEFATANVPRFDHSPSTRQSLGLLVEEARTNSIRNNTMVGAVAGTPGTIPTNWSYIVAGTGLTREIVQTGIENGINYIDLRMYGTAASTTAVTVGIDRGAATTGQSWTESAYFKLAAGSASNITSWNLLITEETSGNVFLTGADYPIATPSNTLTRASATRTLSGGATVAFVFGQIRISCTNGAAIDFTLRIGLPQLEQGAFATSVIPTTTAAATRAETATVSLTGLPATRTLVEKPVGCATVAGDTLTLNAGYTAERVMIFPTALTGTQITAIRGAM